MKITDEQLQWTKRRRHGISPQKLRSMVIAQKGLCAISNVPLRFELKLRTPIKNGRGCHPLSPSIDHIAPGSAKHGFQIICYALNDLKGHLPVECFKALKRTKAWKRLMSKWQEQARKNPESWDAFVQIIKQQPD